MNNNDDTIDMSLISETIQTPNEQRINEIEEVQEESIEIFDMEHETIPVVDEKTKNKKRKSKRPKKKKEKAQKEATPVKKSKLVRLFIVLDILVALGFFLTYGPITYLRTLLISTAMETTSHKYFARIFYDESTILKVLGNNYIEDFEEGTDTSQVKIEENDTTVYESKYEEQILKKTPGNEIYKVIDLEGKNYKGHMIVVYDPSRVELVKSRFIDVGGQKLPSLLSDHDALAGINASGFSRRNNALTCTGPFIMDGEIYTKAAGTNALVGFDKNHVLMLTYDTPEKAIENGMIDGVAFGPFLVVNGVKATIKGTAGGLAPRTAIGQRKDGIVLLVTIDGRRAGHSLGINFNDLAELFMTYKAYNAANLDGGGSSSMVVEGELINVPGGYGYTGARYIPNAWIVK